MFVEVKIILPEPGAVYSCFEFVSSQGVSSMAYDNRFTLPSNETIQFLDIHRYIDLTSRVLGPNKESSSINVNLIPFVPYMLAFKVNLPESCKQSGFQISVGNVQLFSYYYNISLDSEYIHLKFSLNTREQFINFTYTKPCLQEIDNLEISDISIDVIVDTIKDHQYPNTQPTILPTIDNLLNIAMCDLVEATDISTKSLNWNCQNGIPMTSICATWQGILCRDGYISEIRLEYYGLKGTIPSSLGSLTTLTFLQMAGNSLSGTIPKSLGQLTLLYDLWLGSNCLEGSIPTSLGNLLSLQVLSLNENSFSGSIPDMLGKLSSLRVLWLGANKFTGTIPSSLDRLSQLYTAYLNSNKLTGTIPTSLSNLVKLMALSLYSNSLIGSVPLSFSKLTSLTSFRIYGNNLSGTLPAQLCGHSLVDFYPKNIAITSSNNNINNNDKLQCYAACLSSVAFHYYDLLQPCAIDDTMKPTVAPTQGIGSNFDTPTPPPVPSPTPNTPSITTIPDTNYVLMMTSFFLVIFDVAILSMLVLECYGFGRMPV
eukprot:gene5409-10821_t